MWPNPTEEILNRKLHFLRSGGAVTGTVASTQYRMSPIPEGELEIPIQITFNHTSKLIVENLKLFVESQFVKTEPVFLPRRWWKKLRW